MRPDAAGRLLIDIGNTRLKWAWCDALAGGAQHDLAPAEGPLPTPWREAGAVAHDEPATLLAQWAALRGRWGGDGGGTAAAPDIWISNVAGADIAARVETALATVFGTPAIRRVRSVPRFGGLENGYRDPAQLGVDRWIGSIGARRYRPHGHLLIVTAGTATTLDVVSAPAPAAVARGAQGRFEGGLILPGLALMMGALGRNTAQLPTLEIGDALAHTPWADNTHAAIAAGCLAAQAGAIEHSWRALCERGPARCLLSGGARHLLARVLTMPFEMHDNLVLLGLDVMASASEPVAGSGFSC